MPFLCACGQPGMVDMGPDKNDVNRYPCSTCYAQIRPQTRQTVVWKLERDPQTGRMGMVGRPVSPEKILKTLDTVMRGG